jgi:hypothetical protein
MPLFVEISSEATRLGLQFLVIGGHAVAHHHYPRTTEDTDLMISSDDRNSWLELAGKLGLSLFHDGGTFLQFKPSEDTAWRLDLMLVKPATFAKMISASERGEVEGRPVLMPALDHLLALKLHALKHGRGIRVLKDMDDTVNLIVNNRVDVKSTAFRELVLKHGTSELYEKLVGACTE